MASLLVGAMHRVTTGVSLTLPISTDTPRCSLRFALSFTTAAAHQSAARPRPPPRPQRAKMMLSSNQPPPLVRKRPLPIARHKRGVQQLGTGELKPLPTPPHLYPHQRQSRPRPPTVAPHG